MMRPIHIVAAMMLSGFAYGDDGILFFEGAPRLLKGTSQIRLVREFVRLKVGKKGAKVFCRFVLKNDGGPTTARIGFPDGSDHDGDPTEDRKPVLKNFRSSIDGKPASVKTEKSGLPDTTYGYFHTKSVMFTRNQTRIIEDWYEAPFDNCATNTPDYYIKGLQYIMATGGSWKGKVSEAIVQFRFLAKDLHDPHPFPMKSVGKPDEFKNWDKIPKNHIFWQGFAKPIHIGSSLIFKRKDFKPAENSNIRLVFGAHKVKY